VLARAVSSTSSSSTRRNAAGGFGVTKEPRLRLLQAGAHVLTTGNHVWTRRKRFQYIVAEPRLLRR